MPARDPADKDLIDASDWADARQTSKGTGYDVAEAVKQHLKKTGNADKSICEVLQAAGSRHVGKADVFCSHVQALHIAELLCTLDTAAKTFDQCSDKTLYWIDFFSLRQGVKNAFKTEEVIETIGAIGTTLAEVTDDYLDRSFCVLETYATVQAGGTLLVVPPAVMRTTAALARWDALVALADKTLAARIRALEKAQSENTRMLKAMAKLLERPLRVTVERR